VSCAPGETGESAASLGPMAGGSSSAFTKSVYARDLQWCPQGDQEERFGVNGVRPAFEDILLAKLRPGQSIKLECHCQKGLGQDHAKFSPVCTASYRLLPAIEFKVPIVGADAEALVAMCPLKVFDIEDLGKGKPVGAKVSRPRDCSVCRECIRSEGWADKVRLARVPDHFIFKVEAVGMLSPRDIVREAIRILKAKCTTFLGILDGSIADAAMEHAGDSASEDGRDDVEGMLR